MICGVSEIFSLPLFTFAAASVRRIFASRDGLMPVFFAALRITSMSGPSFKLSAPCLFFIFSCLVKDSLAARALFPV